MMGEHCGRRETPSAAKPIGKMDDFALYDLTEEQLNNILALSEVEQVVYFSQLIEKYYTHIDEGTDEYYSLLMSYKSSFNLERVYRDREDIQGSFTAIYTRTGLIRDLVNDLYHTEESLVIH